MADWTTQHPLIAWLDKTGAGIRGVPWTPNGTAATTATAPTPKASTINTPRPSEWGALTDLYMSGNTPYSKNPVGFLDEFAQGWLAPPGDPRRAGEKEPYSFKNNKYWEDWQKMADAVFTDAGYQRNASDRDYSKLTYWNPTSNQTVNYANPFYGFNPTYQYWEPTGTPLADLQSQYEATNNPQPPRPPVPKTNAELQAYLDSGGKFADFGEEGMMNMLLGFNQRSGEASRSRINTDFDRIANQASANAAARGFTGTPEFSLAMAGVQPQRQQAMLDLDQALNAGNMDLVNSIGNSVFNRLERGQDAARTSSENAANRQFQLDLTNAQTPLQLFGLLAELEAGRIGANANTTTQHLNAMQGFNFGYPTGYDALMQGLGGGRTAENMFGDARGKHGLWSIIPGALGGLFGGVGGGLML